MQELGNAINESLSDSDRIAAAIGEIKRAGYDVFLVLEATIGFNKREESEESEEGETIQLGAPAETGRLQLAIRLPTVILQLLATLVATSLSCAQPKKPYTQAQRDFWSFRPVKDYPPP